MIFFFLVHILIILARSKSDRLKQIWTSSLRFVVGDLWIQYNAGSRFLATDQVLLFSTTATIFILSWSALMVLNTISLTEFQWLGSCLDSVVWLNRSCMLGIWILWWSFLFYSICFGEKNWLSWSWQLIGGMILLNRKWSERFISQSDIFFNGADPFLAFSSSYQTKVAAELISSVIFCSDSRSLNYHSTWLNSWIFCFIYGQSIS
jgi:hypothetical protein